MNSKQTNKPHVLVDFDRTLLDTDLFIDELWRAIATEYGVDPEYEKQRATSFYEFFGDWYDYQFFDHIAAIPEITHTQAEFEANIRARLSSKQFLFSDAEPTLNLYDEILTFGNHAYQRFKLSMCPELRDIPVTIIREMKADYVKHHYQAPLVLIDDKRLEDELPEWVDFYLIDRTQEAAVVRHSDSFISISSLRELKGLL